MSLGPLLLSLAALAGPGRPIFPSEVRLVILHPVVRNQRGELVTSLDRSAFTVYENGKAQPITVFHNDDVPVSVGILLDNSGSMVRLRDNVAAAAAAFVRASKPEDELFLMNFADKAGLEVPFTSDRILLESGIARVDAIGGTALRDAIDKAEAYLSSQASRDRKALLLVTDGNDNASVTSRDAILQQAEHGDIAIYALGLEAEGNSARARRGRDALDDLSERTGGSAHFSSGADDIGPLAAAIARQIRSEYTLGYAPLDQALDGSYRKLRVEARGAEHLSVRTRAGYRATADAGAKTQR